MSAATQGSSTSWDTISVSFDLAYSTRGCTYLVKDYNLARLVDLLRFLNDFYLRTHLG